jgi:hypothetical protein
MSNNIKVIEKISVYTGGGSGSDAPPLVFTDKRLGYLMGTTELDFGNSQTIGFDFNKVVVDLDPL